MRACHEDTVGVEVLDGPPALTPARSRELRKGIRRRSRVAVAIANMAQTSEPSDDAFSVLLTAILDPAGHSWRERVAAARALASVPLDRGRRSVAVEALGQCLSGQLRARRGPNVRRSLWLSALLALPVAIGLFVDRILDQGWFFADTAVSYAAGVFVVVGALELLTGTVSLAFIAPALGLRARVVNLRVRAAAAEALGELAEAGASVPVAGALFDLAPVVRRAAWGALPKVLGALDDAWYGRIGPRAVTMLCRALGRGPEATDIAVLGALRHIGGASAVAPVEKLAQAGRSPAIREAAERALPVLRERRRAETDPTRLLRPATSPEDPGSVLLRPASGAPSADDLGTLVRPADD